MFSISRHRNNILKITNNKIIAIKSYVSLKFSYKNIFFFFLVSNATVLYGICTILMPLNMNITNIDTHTQPQLSAFMRFIGFYRVQYYNNLIYNGPNKYYVDNSSVMSTELETEDRYNTTQHITTIKQHSNCNNSCYRSQDCWGQTTRMVKTVVKDELNRKNIVID